MKKIVKLTESELINFVKRLLKEESAQNSWNTAVSIVKKNGVVVSNMKFKYKEGIEGMDEQGIILITDSNKSLEMWMEPNMTFTIWKKDSTGGTGKSIQKGNWKLNGNQVTLKSTAQPIKEQMEDPTEDYFMIIDHVANHAMHEEDNLDEVEKCINEIYKIMEEAYRDDDLTDDQADEIINYGGEVVKELESMFDDE